MSLSISSEKVEEVLEEMLKMENNQPSDIGQPNSDYYSAYDVGGIEYAPAHLVTEEGRQNLHSLRQKIEASGTHLLDSDELDEEMRAMRR
jgi:hypothetical protein